MPIRLPGPSGVRSAGSTQESPRLSSLAARVPSSWRRALRSEIESEGFAKLDKFLLEEERKHRIFPPRAQVFAALSATAPSKVRVVVIGQDPYPTAGNANGLAFSVSPGMKIPASLRNIFAGLHADTGAKIPASGDLTAWAKQGVLLLNTVLTVREGEANSHHDKGWEPFTEAVLRKVNEQDGPVVFLCFGAQARAMAERLVDRTKHTVLSTPHPSPLNGRAFVTAADEDRIFTRVNQILKKGGRTPIDWSLA